MVARKSIQLLTIFCLGMVAAAAVAQTAPNEWVWKGGSSTIPTCSAAGNCGAPGVYGTQNKFAASNIPGARQGAASWTDSSGNFWLFGGYGLDSTGALGYLNDLWEFEPAQKQWAWMGGTSTFPSCSATNECGVSGVYGTLDKAASGNTPGGRANAATWTDKSGHFWLFGGSGYDSAGTFGVPNDLWEFDPSKLEWAWRGGNEVIANPLYPEGNYGVYGTLDSPSAQNIPGGRNNASTWVDDSGNFWLFGGSGIDSLGNDNNLDDLWEFSPASGEWTWKSGASETAVRVCSGVYGTLGVADVANHPGNRKAATNWIDSNGNLWLLGGSGCDGFDVITTLNDLWEFSPSTNEWTWMGGGNSENGSNVYEVNPGIYGALGTFAEGNVPSSRANGVGWTDKDGDFWEFGGSLFGVSDYLDTGYLNDTWEFDRTKNEWAWMGETIATCGSCTQPGVYGTLGTANLANTPGGRVNPASWTDSSGNLWIFGGGGFDGATNYGYLNDLWEYAPVSGTPPATVAPTVSLSPSPSSITSAQALTVTVTVNGSSGKPVPTGSVTLTGGGFTSAGTVLSSGSATITVAAESLLAADDTLTAYYTPDAASVSIYNSTSGSTNVDVASPTPATAARVGVSPLEYWIWTTETLPVTITVYGGGSLAPTGSVVLRGGSFTAAPTTLVAGLDAGGNAQIEIPAGSLPAGTDTLTATYTPDANSSETLTSATATAMVVASVQPMNGLDWTWMGGDNIIPGINNQGGVYGTLGIASPSNFPGGRINFTSWTDSSQNLWIFGGEGNDGNNQHVILNDLWKFDSSTQEWTWVSGTSVYLENNSTGGRDASGVYGTPGKFAAGNIPGSRVGASSWVDASGHLWLFGGYGFTASPLGGPLDDLWEFDPATSEWAWMSGSSDIAGQQSGEPGSYGTLGVAASGNLPAARQNASSWVDKSGNLWLFGGYPQDELPSGCYDSTLNDMWRFSPTTMEWTWMAGSQPYSGQEFCESGPASPAGVYGKLGTPATGNTPGGRDSSATWTDSSGNLWLFGGGIIYDSYGDGTYNDLWEFNPATFEWTWMGGSNTVTTYTHTFESSSSGQAGVYGTLGTPSSTNIPGSRLGAFTWIDSIGNFWLFGGSGLDSNGVPGNLNDLWEFKPSTNEWAWMGGTSTLPPVFAYDGPVGIYGTLGVPASANTPGGRSEGASWIDKSGHLWLFGGESWDAVGQNGWFNDLWEYRSALPTSAITPSVTVTPSPASITTAQALSVTIAVSGGSGNPTPTGSVTLTSGSYTSAAATLNGGSAIVSIPAGSLGTGTDTLTVNYTPDSDSSSIYDTASGSNTVTVTEARTTPTVTVTPASSRITTGQTLSVTVTLSGGSGNPTPTGAVTLASGSYASASIVLTGGSATITIPAGSLAVGTGMLTASYTPDSASLSIYNSATGSNTITVTAATVQVTVGTSPTGLSFSVDGTSYTSKQSLTWIVGASHTITTTSPQTSTGTQNTFASWSDGGAISHSVTAPSSGTSYTATFTTSYQLTSAASPAADGTVTPVSGSYYASGTVVDLAATPNTGYAFVNWTGNVASASSASTTVTMNAPESVTGNFSKATAPIAALAPALSFPNTNVGTISSALVATLSNSGNATLNISGIAIVGTSPSDFAITSGSNACGTTLAGDASCSIYVTFTPASATGFAATLTVTDNATPTTQSVALTGTGTPPPAPVASLTPGTLTFTTVSGSTTAAQTATLSNTGDATLNISGITIGGTNQSDFALTTGANACGTTLASGTSCSVYITFTPASPASFSAILQVADNASGSPQSVVLNGAGTPPPTFTVTSASGAQTIQPGGTATYTITVTAQNGSFSNAVSLSATGLPTGAAAIFTPPSVTPGATSATSTLSIQAGTTTGSARNSSTWPLAAPALAIIGMLCLPGKRRRRWITMALLLVVSLGAFTALTACGGGFSLTQPAQSYTITVTGTSGTDVQTTTVQLTVQ